MTGDNGQPAVPPGPAAPAAPVVRLTLGYVSRTSTRSGRPVLLPHHQVAGPDPGGRYQRYLASVIGSMTRSQAACDHLLSLLASVERGDERSAGFEGEQVEITFTPAGAQIDITVEDDWTGQPEGWFSLAQVRAVIEAKKRFLSLPPGPGAEVAIELPAERLG